MTGRTRVPRDGDRRARWYLLGEAHPPCLAGSRCSDCGRLLGEWRALWREHQWLVANDPAEAQARSLLENWYGRAAASPDEP